MKKITITLLALVLALAFTACTGNTAATTTTTTVAETTTAAQNEEKAIFYYGEIAYGAADEESLYEKSLDLCGDAVFDDGTTIDQYHCKIFNDMNSALLALKKKDIYALDLAKNVAEYIVAQNPDQFVVNGYGSTSNIMAFAMALKSENTALKDELNTAIAALKKDGTLEALEKEYLSDLTKLPEAKDIPTIEGAETIKVVVTGDMPPFDYVTADGKAAGYNVALLSAISEKINKNIELVYANAGSRYIQLTSGKADVIFWARGEKYSETAEFSFANDLPEGMAVTDSYITQEWRDIRVKEN